MKRNSFYTVRMSDRNRTVHEVYRDHVIEGQETTELPWKNPSRVVTGIILFFQGLTEHQPSS